MSPRTKEDNLKIQEQTRLKIVMAALKAFGEKGYASTTVSQIAKEAGVSKGLIYHYFSSKEEVLKGIFDMMVQEGEVIMGGWENKSTKEKLRHTITESVSFIKNQPNVMRFMMSLALQPAAIAYLEEVMESQKAETMARYGALFAELGFSDPEAEAYYTGAVMDGAAMGYLSTKDYPLEKIVQILLNRYDL